MTERNIPVIGLMGAPGSGKSLVARQLASLGCTVIDSDALAKQILDEPDVLTTLQAWWGGAVVDGSGRADRAALAQIVFEAPQELERLESLIHPQVHARRQALRQQALAGPATRAIVEDSPLLIETGIDRECDALIFVDAPREVRLERLARTRGWDAAELDRREKRQMPLDSKRRQADYVISNDAGEAHCLEQTRRVLSRITH